MAEQEKPFAFLQWKGTDACFDFHCDCGLFGHFDGFFAAAVRCPKCGAEWEMPSILVPKKLGTDYVGPPPRDLDFDMEDEE